MYIPSISNGDPFQVTVERGSGMNASDLTNRTAPASRLLDRLRHRRPLRVRHDYAAGMAGKAADAAWAQNDTVDYRITLQPKDDPTADAHTSAVSTGSFSITWEAHSN